MNRNTIFYILLGLAVAGMGTLFFTVPSALDDYWYLADFAKGAVGDDGSFSFLRGWYECVKIHHLTDNSRLCNIIGAALLHLPLWVSSIGSTVAVALTLVFMLRLSGVRHGNIPALTAIAAGYILLVPWQDFLFTRIFAYNYVWASAFMTGTILLFLRERPTRWYWAFILGIVTGAWHEGFSLPVFCGCVGCVVLHPRMLRGDRAWLIGGLLLGGLWLFLSPSRTSGTGYWSLAHYSRPFTPLLSEHPLTFALLLLELVFLAIPSTRRTALAPVAIFAVAGSLLSLGVHLLSYLPRTTTPGIVMETVGIVFLLRALPRPNKAVNRCLDVVSALVWIFITAHLVAAAITGIKFCREEHFIQKEYQKSKNRDGVVFSDVLGYYKAPWITFGKPVQTLYCHYAHPALVGEYYNAKMLKVIPAALKSYTEGEGRSLGGDIGAKVSDGWLVMPASPGRDPEATFFNGKFIYADHQVTGSYLAYSFTGADSKTYLFVLIDTDGLVAVNQLNNN